MTLFNLDVSDDYLCQGFKKNFNKISKHNFLKRRFAFRKVVNNRCILLDDNLRKLNNVFAESNRSNYQYTLKEKTQVYEKVCNMINKSFFNEEQKANISIIKHLLEKQSDLQMQIKSIESEIKLLANDI